MSLRAAREEGKHLSGPLAEPAFDDIRDRYLNADKKFAHMMNRVFKTAYLAESFPEFSTYIGAGSMALYLGSDAIFKEDTVWFTECIERYDGLELSYNSDNYWWKLHLGLIKRCAELVAGTDIIVGIPDIVENIDILSAMRGPSRCCFDLYDYPDGVKKALSQITDLYPIYYNQIYDVVKKPDGSSAYGPFCVYGSGKSAKLQCDFNALISPGHFDEFIMPCLRRQCGELDNTIFHLDGEECVVHVDSLLTLDRLGAIQWTPPPGSSEIKAANSKWFDLYRKILSGGKGLWLSVAEYGPEGSIEAADKIVRAIGARGLYFQFPEMEYKLAESLLAHAEKNWRC
jgi:5-methyltetrahydrofolate--homocysteine methyltransferase